MTVRRLHRVVRITCRNLLLALTLLGVSKAGLCEQLPPSDLEHTVCGWFKERFAFENWSSAAGEPDDALVAAVPTAQRVEHRTQDGRTLVGFRVSAAPGVAKVGTILVIQGNGTLADQMLQDLVRFGELGIESVIYDFRGYGRSNGERRLRAMISDYREIISEFANSTAGKVGVYSMSFGGILALNSIDVAPPSLRLIVDSTPSLISPLGCPAELDPVRHVPRAAANLLAITGEKDEVVPPARTRALGTAIGTNGGKYVLGKDLGHPFMDGLSQIDIRVRLVTQFVSE